MTTSHVTRGSSLLLPALFLVVQLTLQSHLLAVACSTPPLAASSSSSPSSSSSSPSASASCSSSSSPSSPSSSHPSLACSAADRCDSDVVLVQRTSRLSTLRAQHSESDADSEGSIALSDAQEVASAKVATAAKAAKTASAAAAEASARATAAGAIATTTPEQRAPAPASAPTLSLLKDGQQSSEDRPKSSQNFPKDSRDLGSAEAEEAEGSNEQRHPSTPSSPFVPHSKKLEALIQMARGGLEGAAMRREQIGWPLVGLLATGLLTISVLACFISARSMESAPVKECQKGGWKEAQQPPYLPALQRSAYARPGTGKAQEARLRQEGGDAAAGSLLEHGRPMTGSPCFGSSSIVPGRGSTPAAGGGSSFITPASVASIRADSLCPMKLPPGSARFTFNSMANMKTEMEAQLAATPSTSPMPSARKTTDLEPLCPCLVVPEGMELVFAVRDLLSTEKQQLSFCVVDLQGDPLSYVVVKEAGFHCGILLQMLDQTPLAWINTKPLHTSKGVIEVCHPSGEVYGVVAKEEAGPRTRFTLRDTSGQRICTFHGDFREKAINGVSQAGRLICDTERCELGSEGTPYYQVRVAPGIDAGLVLCCLLAIDKVEGQSHGSSTPGPLSARTPGPLTARTFQLATP